MSMSTEISSLTAEAKRALLAQLLKQKAARAEAPAPLSYGQRAWWFLYQLEPQNAAYNIILPARILSELDVDALRRALAELVARHASLRTTFAAGPCSGSTRRPRSASSSRTPRRGRRGVLSARCSKSLTARSTSNAAPSCA